MGWFCTHSTTKNLKFVKTFKKTAKKRHFSIKNTDFLQELSHLTQMSLYNNSASGI